MARILSLRLLLLAFTYSGCITAQYSSFDVSLNPIEIDGVGGLQSFAYGQHDGYWLIVGGRLDGLHRRQPWAAFDEQGHNTNLLLIHPESGQSWSAPLTTLSTALQEQLSSTNMQFIQTGGYLYLLGGYGFSATANDHTTYDQLVAINLPAVIADILSGEELSDAFRQISDPEFQVTGGRLQQLGEVYHLLGGQKFLGRYNPMGPEFGPGFIQEYTNAIRRFTIADDGVDITITHLEAFESEADLHRRDYNAEAQIMPDGSEGITMFSGVFQPVVDLPWLNSVDVGENDYTVNNSFEQLFNHYHCPVLTAHSESEQEMHSVFFGGIAQFYEEDGYLIQDDNVPFVRSISRVTRDGAGLMTETLLAQEMPSLLGAGGEFIPLPGLERHTNDVLKLDALTGDSVLVGHIFGGIESSDLNIFFINNGVESSASATIYEVYLKPAEALEVDQTIRIKHGTLEVQVYPNPMRETLQIHLTVGVHTDIELSLIDDQGKVVLHAERTGLNRGEHTLNFDLKDISSGSYVLHISNFFESRQQRITVLK